jgi:hypothetical protein
VAPSESLPLHRGCTEDTLSDLPLPAGVQKKDRQWTSVDAVGASGDCEGFIHQQSAEEFLGRYSVTARGHHKILKARGVQIVDRARPARSNVVFLAIPAFDPTGQ